MTWARIDDAFPEHHKVAGLSDAAFRAHVSAICYASRNLTDGEVATGVAKLYGWQRRAPELVKAGLWETTADGWRIHDFLEYNPARETVEREREAARERMANARKNKSRSSKDVRPNISRTSPEVPAQFPGSSRYPDPDPLPPAQESEDSFAVSGGGDSAFGERYRALAFAFGERDVTARMSAEFEQIAEDWPDIAVIGAAIRECQRANKKPFPSEVRKYLPALRPAAPASDPEWRDTAPPLYDPSENTPEKRAQRLAEAEARDRERYTPEQLAEFEREAAEIRARHAERKAASR